MRIVTWNIQYGKGADGAVDLARIVVEAVKFADADVFCFQEVAVNFPALDGGKGVDQPAMLASLLPDYAPIFRPALDIGTGPGRRQFGNMILSRVPVIQVLPHLLSRPAERGGRSMQRQALEVVIASKTGPLRIITTHLEYFSAKHRLAQIDQLRALHEEACLRMAEPDATDDSEGTYRTLARPTAAILCGDFNCTPEGLEYPRLLAPFASATPQFLDAWNIAHSGAPHPLTAGLYDHVQWNKGPLACDFIFVTEDVVPRLRRTEIDVATQASDHQPLMIELAD